MNLLRSILFPVPAADRTPTRVPVVDILRGLAIVLMIGYHACWDLAYFGLARLDLFDDVVWLVVRTTILCLFLGLVGVSLVLATREGIVWRKVALRLAMVGGCAAAVTLASWRFTPDGLIFFGVLHLVALASLLGLAFIRLPPAATVLAAGLVLAAPAWLMGPVFDRDWLAWLGLMSHDVQSNDYVPLLPWFGVVLGGIVVGRLACAAVAIGGRAATVAAWQPVAWPTRLLGWAGRHSLVIYMLHQPVLWGAGLLVVTLAGVSVPGGTPEPARPDTQFLPDRAEGFLGSCQVSCEKSGGSLTRCAGYCRCVAGDLEGQGLWQGFHDRSLDKAGITRVGGIVTACAARQAAP